MGEVRRPPGPRPPVKFRIVRCPELTRPEGHLMGKTLLLPTDLFRSLVGRPPKDVARLLNETPIITWPELTPAGYASLKDRLELLPTENVLYVH